MADRPAQIFVYEHGDTLVFRVAGRGTMCHCVALRSRAEQALGQGVRRLMVDLRECTYFDSTFLGMLLMLKRAAERGGAEFALIDPSPECRRLLGQMRLDGHFPHVGPVCEAGPCCELATDHDSSSFQWNVVCAHQELASLEGPGAVGFRALAERLAAEFKASAPGRSAP